MIVKGMPSEDALTQFCMGYATRQLTFSTMPSVTWLQRRREAAKVVEERTKEKKMKEEEDDEEGEGGEKSGNEGKGRRLLNETPRVHTEGTAINDINPAWGRRRRCS